LAQGLFAGALALLAGFLCHVSPDTNTRGPQMATGRPDRALAALLGALIALSALLGARFGLARDAALSTIAAAPMLGGGMPYRDAFDFKPPGIYLVYALARLCFGSWPHGVRIFEAAGLLATAWALAELASRWWGNRLIGLVA